MLYVFWIVATAIITWKISKAFYYVKVRTDADFIMSIVEKKMYDLPMKLLKTKSKIRKEVEEIYDEND